MKVVKLFAIRVYNRTRSCILMRSYVTGMMAMPTLMIPSEDDPADHLDEIMKQVSGTFEMMSAVNILEYTIEDETEGEKTKYESVVYDVKYKGKVLPNLSPGENKYTSGKWMTIDALNKQGRLNHPTEALVMAMEKEPSLK